MTQEQERAAIEAAYDSLPGAAADARVSMAQLIGRDPREGFAWEYDGEENV